MQPNIGTGQEPSKAWTSAPCVCTSSLCGSVVSMNGLESFTLSPVPLPGPVLAATWCGQTPAQTPFAVDAQRMRSRQIFTASGRAQQTGRLTELRRVNICWPKPAAIGSHARSFGSEDASREPGLNPGCHGTWAHNPSRCMLFPVFMGQEMSPLWVWTCCGQCPWEFEAVAYLLRGLKRSPDGSPREASGFPVLPSAHQGARHVHL